MALVRGQPVADRARDGDRGAAGDALGSDHNWTYRFLRARANSIEGGTTEILKNIVAERVLGLPRMRMNFGFTDDQQAIKRTAREFLAARYPLATVRALAEDDRGFTDEQWPELVELGWPGVIVPEDRDGLGLGVVELVVIAEEMGYALAPSPWFSTTCAALLLVAAGTAEQRERWLAPLARGELRGTVAVWDEHSGWAPDHSEVELAPDGLSPA